MQIKALRYLDNEIRKDFETTPQRIGYEQILYLYVRSLYRDIPLGDALTAHKYFIALAQKQWSDFTLYEKALTAVTLNRYGFKQEAQNILKSLRQYAVTNNEPVSYTHLDVYKRQSSHSTRSIKHPDTSLPGSVSIFYFSISYFYFPYCQ